MRFTDEMMSGDVRAWSVFGSLVGVSFLSTMCVEFYMMSVISFTLMSCGIRVL